MALPPNPLTIERRVEFSQTDAAGLIHFSTYYTFMEAAEAELFRQLDIPLLWSNGTRTNGFPRVDCRCKFRHPLAFDEPVRIELEIEAILANRIHYTFTFHGPGDVRCAHGSMVTACAARDSGGELHAAPIPETMLKALEEWKNQPA